jgi:hypothetical protein
VYREINLNFTISFLLPAALMSLVACGEGSQIADNPTPVPIAAANMTKN